MSLPLPYRANRRMPLRNPSADDSNAGLRRPQETALKLMGVVLVVRCLRMSVGEPMTWQGGRCPR